MKRTIEDINKRAKELGLAQTTEKQQYQNFIDAIWYLYGIDADALPDEEWCELTNYLEGVGKHQRCE